MQNSLAQLDLESAEALLQVYNTVYNYIRL